ncbi:MULTISPECIES: ArsR/SmtB family transcription factor [Lapidilactobacillus]|jgi:DNA-binding transcriptional ArsR family regulator|uniref:ArsR/SmtB family transcription factor n=1 Tax=Lapidilactobacillus gannanensis TaxID=2486002 RepID=A0ABW4BN76_9LACO|nr:MULTISPECIES: metalloregulator ArsR/SmtB family transcription factor [Lapidilactobacillus]MCH4058098.1 metalloregulator ArsR/SmtB family transcription factor [Lactobacillaceae bacterium]
MTEEIDWSHDDDLIENVQRIFHILSNETRLRIILTLDQNERNVQQLQEAVGLSQSAISHQLAILRECNLVNSERIGKTRVYRLSDDHVKGMINTLLIHSREHPQD